MMMISVREEVSLGHIKKLSLQNKNVLLTTDNAFLLFDKNKTLKKAKASSSLRLAVCFRRWANEKETTEVIDKAIKLCTHLLDTYPNSQLTFLSTCQGITGYVKDSLIAEKIVAALAPSLATRCIINTDHHHPQQLIEVYSSFDAYIGMRLHGAILSMLGQTPAFNIGYELKSQGIYQAMDLTAYQIHYQDSIEHWTSQADSFLKDIQEISTKLPAIIENQQAIAMDHMKQMKDIYTDRST